MRKTVIVSILFFIIIFGFCFYKHVKKGYYFNIEGQMLIDTHSHIESAVQDFYNKYGEYPLNVLSYNDEIDETDSVLNRTYAINGFHMMDYFAKDANQLVYYPLYNPYTKKRESFIILSVGIDGKLNNLFAEADSLYLNSWWDKVSLYNLGEYLISKYKGYTDSRSTTYLCDYKQPAGTEMLVRVIEGSQDKFPKFSIVDYLWGKKDLLLQLDSMQYSYIVVDVSN